MSQITPDSQSPDALEVRVACYEQNCLQMRSLNQIMWQVPMIAMTLTGGLWFGLSSSATLDGDVKTILLAFCAICNLVLVFVIQRVRSVMEAYLDRIKAFSPEDYADTQRLPKRTFLQDKSVCHMFSFLMLCAAALSAWAAFLLACKQ